MIPGDTYSLAELRRRRRCSPFSMRITSRSVARVRLEKWAGWRGREAGMEQREMQDLPVIIPPLVTDSDPSDPSSPSDVSTF